ncbi:hypothetical protein B0H14DRAFT_3149768 [Mycena olivaceomarginata]|nr:hypothetical protein B0H14DRAFT_3149768 [Mycena olivaceomarginata]
MPAPAFTSEALLQSCPMCNALLSPQGMGTTSGGTGGARDAGENVEAAREVEAVLRIGRVGQAMMVTATLGRVRGAAEGTGSTGRRPQSGLWIGSRKTPQPEKRQSFAATTAKKRSLPDSENQEPVVTKKSRPSVVMDSIKINALASHPHRPLGAKPKYYLAQSTAAVRSAETPFTFSDRSPGNMR